jgi:hypothetical protein
MLQGNRPRAADEEDVALSAFHSFCRDAEAGRFPELGDRKDLWQILVMLTARKAWALIEHEGRQKTRRGSRVPSVLPSSIRMISLAIGTARTRRTISSSVLRSLKVGITTDSSGAAAIQGSSTK